jgi:hypothetical protein
MQVMGTLHQADDPIKGKLKKGNAFPEDALTGDMYTLINGDNEATYIKHPEGWVRILLEGDYIDAGTY